MVSLEVEQGSFPLLGNPVQAPCRRSRWGAFSFVAGVFESPKRSQMFLSTSLSTFLTTQDGKSLFLFYFLRCGKCRNGLPLRHNPRSSYSLPNSGTCRRTRRRGLAVPTLRAKQSPFSIFNPSALERQGEFPALRWRDDLNLGSPVWGLRSCTGGDLALLTAPRCRASEPAKSRCVR